MTTTSRASTSATPTTLSLLAITQRQYLDAQAGVGPGIAALDKKFPADVDWDMRDFCADVAWVYATWAQNMRSTDWAIPDKDELFSAMAAAVEAQAAVWTSCAKAKSESAARKIANSVDVRLADAAAQADDPIRLLLGIERIPLTRREILASLAPSVNAWIRKPVDKGVGAIVAAAESLLGGGRLLSEDAFVRSLSDAETSSDVIDALAGYEEGFLKLPFVLEEGTFLVGDEVPPGVYRTLSSTIENCYWETLSASGNINRNNFVTAAFQVLMTVRSSDFSVSTSRCGRWIKVR